MKHLTFDEFSVGFATLERFYHRKLVAGDRDIYYETVKETTPPKWSKVIQYAVRVSKNLPKPVELREWLGLGAPLTPDEEARGFTPGTIHGISPADLVHLVRINADLPFEQPWQDEVEKTVFLDVAYASPPPKFAPTDDPQEMLRRVPIIMAHIRRLSELAQSEYERCKPAGKVAP